VQINPVNVAAEDIKKHMKHLTDYFDRLLEAIFASADRCPVYRLSLSVCVCVDWMLFFACH
jgi:hypothetical protein